MSEDPVFEAAIKAGKSPDEARALSDADALRRQAEAKAKAEESAPPSADTLKGIYHKSDPEQPGFKPEETGFDQAMYDNLLARGYNEPFCKEKASEAGRAAFLRNVYRTSKPR